MNDIYDITVNFTRHFPTKINASQIISGLWYLLNPSITSNKIIKARLG